jgi:esterase
VQDWGMRKFLTTNLERAVEGDGWRWQINLPVITAALPALEQSPLERGEVYVGPTLWVTGAKSRYVGVEDWRGIGEHFPHTRPVEIADAGHNPHMETRGEFVAAVRAMLR